ncbi:hypothetical protein [Aquimarina algiphila]|uniref:Rubredoxin-like domain-containing protein n=1 Tax=Aquimarina algiphila TaxID=2047982 RepID=A0A554VE42_9FLAO|nr:hypothetical protein [Aquimarina algiphila]TSE05235.1 hypothetical protein FOF46_23515 [Aquimarina algiphila]
MEEFTGTYYICDECSHIYDYDDLCPDCGSGFVTDLNANEVKQRALNEPVSEYRRLHDMLLKHDDL